MPADLISELLVAANCDVAETPSEVRYENESVRFLDTGEEERPSSRNASTHRVLQWLRGISEAGNCA
jgi:hypothetical protein